MAFLERLGNFIWNPWLLGCFLLVGLYFSVRTGFFQIFSCPLWLKTTLGSILRPRRREKSKKGLTQLQAMATALASTIGTGSIAGVATAIAYGGPGAVFWMWMSALLGMMTGCGEKILAVRHRERGADGRWKGGPMQYMEKGLRLPGLAKLFALFCIAETLTGGNLAQANSIAGALSAAGGLSPAAVGIVLAAVTAIVLMGGIKRIGRICELLVPAMALLFVGGGLAVIAANYQAVPQAFAEIVGYAFAPRAVAGGYAMGTALRYGVARGVFTNEAGVGMSAIAHACADVDEPAQQGMWGIFEVFFATMVICTVTALVILTSGVYDPAAMLPLAEGGAVPRELLGAPLCRPVRRSGGMDRVGELDPVRLYLPDWLGILRAAGGGDPHARPVGPGAVPAGVSRLHRAGGGGGRDGGMAGGGRVQRPAGGGKPARAAAAVPRGAVPAAILAGGAKKENGELGRIHLTMGEKLV